MRFVLCLILFGALPAAGQFGGMSASGNGATGTITISSGPGPYRMARTEGAPYSGTPQNQSIQTLPDGTHITHPVMAREKTYRDSAGRIRTERDLFGGRAGRNAFQLVIVKDPIAGFAYLIDSSNSVVHRVPIQAAVQPVNRQFVPPVGTHTSPDGTINVTESIGAQVMFGVSVTGTKTTTTHPAGSRMGNDRPITTVSEQWWSPQLGLTVSSQYTGADGSIQTANMSDLSLAEPDPSLFQVPPGYRIVDETGSFTFTVKLQN